MSIFSGVASANNSHLHLLPPHLDTVQQTWTPLSLSHSWTTWTSTAKQIGLQQETSHSTKLVPIPPYQSAFGFGYTQDLHRVLNR